MNISRAHSASPVRRRALRPALAIAGLAVVATSLTACSSDAESQAKDTTCGEFTSKSEADQVQFMKDFYAGDDEFKEVKTQLDAAGDEAYSATADAIAGICAGKDDDSIYDVLVDYGGGS